MILQDLGYTMHDQDSELIFSKESHQGTFYIKFYKSIEMVECYQDDDHTLLLDIHEIQGITEMMKEMGWGNGIV